MPAGLELEGRKFAELFATEDQRIGMTSFLAARTREGHVRRSLTGRLQVVAYQFTIDDVRFLSGPAGADALAAADALPLTDSSLLADLTRLRAAAGGAGGGGGRDGAAAPPGGRQARPTAADWLFTDEALQQATPGRWPQHRARRLAGVGVHDLTCSIGADLAALRVGVLARRCPVWARISIRSGC